MKLMITSSDKIQQLETLIQSLGNVIVGYSGGVDSTLVSYVASKMLSNNALIVLAATETITSEDIELARTIAQNYHFNFREIAYNELEIENYTKNPINRCYFCRNFTGSLARLQKKKIYR
jgi:uncharacterized protein